MLGGIAFSVYEWLKCALARHSFLIVEGSIDKMKNIYPLNSRFTLPFAFVLAVSLLAVSLMFMLPGGLLHAQTGPIEYPENGTGPVATFTAIDPEGESIVWSLAAGGDMEDFSIENGVLRFKSSPDFESPGNDSNTYEVTVQASDGGQGTTATEVVTIEVTNVDEDGTVTLSTLQPQVGVEIMATLDDPDNVTANTDSWQWYRGNSEIVGATQASYAPTAGDVGSILRATAMYDDGEDEDKTAQEESAHAVRQAPDSNIPPSFPDQDLNTQGAQTEQTREVVENTPVGTNLGAPVAASDPDVLTYSLSGTDEESFDITRATGQLITKAPLDHETEDMYTVTVTATDPFGAMVTSQVTITVTDVNEAPMVEGAASIDHAESGTELDTDADTDGVEAANYTVSDPDEDDTQTELEVTLRGNDRDKFSIENGLLAFKANPDFESPGDSGANNVYEVTVKVTDSKGNSDEQDVTVKVTNIEEDGVVTLSTLQPRVGFPVTATLADPDNITADSLSWQWYNDTINTNDLTENAIEDATSAIYTPMADNVGDTLTARATYTDGNPNEDDAKDVATGAAANPVLVDTRNKAPEFPDLDPDMEGRQTAQERAIVENTASGTDIGDLVAAIDEDMNLTYSLGGPDAASFDIVRNSGQLQTKAELDKETKDTYTVTVTAEDSLNDSSTITVTIKVTNVDEMPDLEGDAPEKYAENGTRPVATFTAIDPEGESIVWSLAAGGDMEDFAIENGVLRFKSSPDFESPGNDSNTYEVTVQASDGGQGTTATEVVTIEVTNVDEDGTVTLSTLQPQVGVAITATLADPDTITAQGTISWQWSRGRSPIVGANDGVGTTSSSYTPAAGDVGSVLRATATYRDAEDTDNDKTAQEVSYRSIRRAPEINTNPLFPDQDLNTQGAQTEQTREVAENTRAGTNLGAPVAANDPGDLLTYSLDDGNDAAAFDINRSTGQLMTKAALDHETGPSYTVTVTATDPFGATATSRVTIMVTDVNEAPMVEGASSIDHVEGPRTDGTDATMLDIAETVGVQAAEYAATDEDTDDNANDLKWSLSGADASKFDISTTGGATRTLSLKEAPDYESPGDSGRDNVYEVTVKVTDTKGNSDEKDVTVKVTNVEEDGTITLSTLQPRVDFSVTATLADPDNITAGSVSWQWYKGNVTQAGLDALDGAECVDASTNNCFIKGATSTTYTPVAFDVGDTVVAVALYTDGSPNAVADAEDFAMMVTANSVLADTRNKAPVFPDEDQERIVLEDADPGAPVGDPVAAMDSIIDVTTGASTLEILTYSLGGDDADSFSIDRASGQLSTKAALDKETKDTYTVTVTATDPSGETATVTVTIEVTGVDEAPTIMIGGLAISGPSNMDYAENDTGPVATYMVSGPDAASASWSLEGSDAGDFDISGGGVLTFRSSPDYEMPADADTDNTYMVTVKANDGTYMDTHEVAITVTDVDEVPLEISGMSQPMYAENGIGAVATYMVAGYNAASAAWTLEGPDAGDFTISGGVLVFRSPPDYETKTTYMVTVKAAAGADMDTHEVVIMVTDVDEVPTIAGDATIDYPENGMGDVATYTAMDPEEATITWSLAGADAAALDITDGVLTFKESPDYEMPADADTDNIYMVTVEASDGTNMDTLAVTITVTDGEDTVVEQTLLETYDENGNDQIDKSEAVAAIRDYIAGQIDKADVVEIIRLYITG